MQQPRGLAERKMRAAKLPDGALQSPGGGCYGRVQQQQQQQPPRCDQVGSDAGDRGVTLAPQHANHHHALGGCPPDPSGPGEFWAKAPPADRCAAPGGSYCGGGGRPAAPKPARAGEAGDVHRIPPGAAAPAHGGGEQPRPRAGADDQSESLPCFANQSIVNPSLWSGPAAPDGGRRGSPAFAALESPPDKPAPLTFPQSADVPPQPQQQPGVTPLAMHHGTGDHHPARMSLAALTQPHPDHRSLDTPETTPSFTSRPASLQTPLTGSPLYIPHAFVSSPFLHQPVSDPCCPPATDTRKCSGSSTASTVSAVQGGGVKCPDGGSDDPSKSDGIGLKNTPSSSPAFIWDGWRYPAGLNRKERRAIMFPQDKRVVSSKRFIGRVWVGLQVQNGTLADESESAATPVPYPGIPSSPLSPGFPTASPVVDFQLSPATQTVGTPKCPGLKPAASWISFDSFKHQPFNAAAAPGNGGLPLQQTVNSSLCGVPYSTSTLQPSCPSTPATTSQYLGASLPTSPLDLGRCASDTAVCAAWPGLEQPRVVKPLAAPLLDLYLPPEGVAGAPAGAPPLPHAAARDSPGPRPLKAAPGGGGMWGCWSPSTQGLSPSGTPLTAAQRVVVPSPSPAVDGCRGGDPAVACQGKAVFAADESCPTATTKAVSTGTQHAGSTVACEGACPAGAPDDMRSLLGTPRREHDAGCPDLLSAENEGSDCQSPVSSMCPSPSPSPPRSPKAENMPPLMDELSDSENP
eukprot:gene17254-26488_t